LVIVRKRAGCGAKRTADDSTLKQSRARDGADGKARAGADGSTRESAIPCRIAAACDEQRTAKGKKRNEAHGHLLSSSHHAGSIEQSSWQENGAEAA
jgi:hypothetical protein